MGKGWGLNLENLVWLQNSSTLSGKSDPTDYREYIRFFPFSTLYNCSITDPVISTKTCWKPSFIWHTINSDKITAAVIYIIFFINSHVDIIIFILLPSIIMAAVIHYYSSSSSCSFIETFQILFLIFLHNQYISVEDIINLLALSSFTSPWECCFFLCFFLYPVFCQCL